MFKERSPVAWAYHENTKRWPFNTLEPEEPWAGAPFKESPELPFTPLPPSDAIDVALVEAIRRRVSCRRFDRSSIRTAALGTLLSLSYGIEGIAQLGSKEHPERPVPSGGGLYPLELYVLARGVEGLAPGAYHYCPIGHGLECTSSVELSDELVSQLFLHQPYVASASAVFVISAVFERLLHKYRDRGYRYILLEAGHVAQNLCLVAQGLGLGALPIGGFFDAFVGNLLGLDAATEAALYGVAIGRPAATDRVAVRDMETALET